MNRINLRTFISILSLFTVSSLMSQQTIHEDDVRASVEKFADAFLRADVSTLSNLLCENYIHINGSSGNIINKADWLSWINSRRLSLDKGELIISAYKVEDLKIQIFGETAIATGVVKSHGKRNGSSFNSHIRFSNVWVIEDGILRRAAFHDSAIRETK